MPFFRRGKKGGEHETAPSTAANGGGSLTTVDSPSGSSTGKHGMFIFEDKPANDNGIIDIVAVHGLNGHYEDTWTWKSGSQKSNWLKEFLPRQIPNARIMSYGYDSAVAFSKSTADITTFAEALLNELIARRDTSVEKTRPIVFICHSLGGIVFKKVHFCLCSQCI
jgi:hypothetical protein